MATEVAACLLHLVAVNFVPPAPSLLPVFFSNSYQILHSDMIPDILSQHGKEKLVFNFDQSHIKCHVFSHDM
jgi:hypothetical protein